MTHHPSLVRETELQREIGRATAGLHALLDVNGDPDAVLAALHQARRELEALILRVEGAVPTKRRRKARRSA